VLVAMRAYSIFTGDELLPDCNRSASRTVQKEWHWRANHVIAQIHLGCTVVLATCPGNLAVVRDLTSGSVRFGSRTGQKPELLLSWRVVIRPGYRTAGIWPDWNRTAVPNIRFLQLWLQLSI
jgi:hypothetical protein